MATSTKSRLTGERPQQGVTPTRCSPCTRPATAPSWTASERGASSTSAVGRASSRPGSSDPGCEVVGVDYSSDAVGDGRRPLRPRRPAGGPDGRRWAWASRTASFDGACSSHLIEHFTDPEPHVAELARVLKDDGLACVLTPNKPADFENPFHLHLFDRDELRAMLERHFGDVWLGGVDAAPRREGRHRGPPDPGEQAAPARRLRPAAPHAARVVRVGVHPAAARWPTGWWPGGTPGASPASPPTTGSSPTSPTTRRSSCSPSPGRRAGRPPADAGRRPDRRHRLGQVGRRRPAGRAGRRADRRRPGGPRRGGARRPRLPAAGRPLRTGDPGRRRDHRPQGAGRGGLRRRGDPAGAQRHHAPGHRHRHDRGPRRARRTPTTS